MLVNENIQEKAKELDNQAEVKETANDQFYDSKDNLGTNSTFTVYNII